ncbi:hypothetical protein F5887DRAFT_1156874 [Amanita rubescens]|nr:hypothetical protein F5887DRAFT_1156874 [Amanita rubescens]
MFGGDILTLWCVVYGSSVPFQIFVHPNVNVNYLKEEIQKKKKVFRDHDAANLVLWKVGLYLWDLRFHLTLSCQIHDPEPVEPARTLAERIRLRGDLEMFAKELTIPTQKVSALFPQSDPPPEDHVHFLVQLPSNDTRSWLAVIHSKLWGEHESFGDIFRTVILTKDDFNELQVRLDEQNPERISDSYVAKNVLATKSEFLRFKSTPLNTEFGDSLVPRLVFNASSDVVANDDAVADDAMDTDPDHGSSDHVDPHIAHLSNEAKAIFPCIIRYVDLTVLKLKEDLRVPQLMLFRNEWGSMIDLFNKREKGIEGSAVFTGQQGIGKTCLLYSILILCIIRAQSIVFQDIYGEVFIIDGNGVRAPEDAPAVSGDADNVLTLIDADAKCYEPSRYLLNNSRHRILLTSSPRSRKDRNWLKQFAHHHNAVFVMEPWSRKEFVVASFVVPAKDRHHSQTTSGSYPIFAGTYLVHVSVAAVSPNKVDQGKSLIRSAIQEIQDLFDVVLHTQDSDKSQTIHRAFQVRPKSSENRFWESRIVEPVSAWALSEMLIELRKKSMGDAYKFYCTIKGSPESARLRGHIFEIYLHRYLEISRTLTIESLDNSSATPEIRFTSGTNHLDFEDNRFSDHLASSVQSNTSWYLRPQSPVFPSFDSFLYLPEISHPGFSPLIALQVTTAADHDINIKGLEKVQRALKPRDPNLRGLRPAKDNKMIILFVVPPALGTTFGAQKITGKAKVDHWYDKTAQYVVTVSEEELFTFYAQTETTNTAQA